MIQVLSPAPVLVDSKRHHVERIVVFPGHTKGQELYHRSRHFRRQAQRAVLMADLRFIHNLEINCMRC